jgi:hypothetical protein
MPALNEYDSRSTHPRSLAGRRPTLIPMQHAATVQQWCNNGATTVKQRCNNGATTGKKVNMVSISLSVLEIRRFQGFQDEQMEQMEQMEQNDRVHKWNT